MSTSPNNESGYDIEVEDDEPYWTDFLRPIPLLAVAVVPFTPYWEQVADPDDRGSKYAIYSRVLAAIGPVVFTLLCGGIGLLMLAYEIRRRRKRKHPAPGGLQD